MTSCCIILAKYGEKDKTSWEIRERSLLEWVLAATEGYERIVATDIPNRIPTKLTVVKDREKAGHINSVIAHAAAGTNADILHIVQTTSPFISPWTIKAASWLLADSQRWNSAQAVTPVPHQLHAWNQRQVSDGAVAWAYPEERVRYPTKQTKPQHWQFGGLFSVRRKVFLRTGSLWAPNSTYTVVPWWQAIDVDDLDGLELARAVAKYRGLQCAS